MSAVRSAEDWLSRLQSIIQSYHEQSQSEFGDDEILLLTAIASIRDLGLNSGDAVRYLKPHLKGI